MTGRERLNAVLQKQATDRLPWTTLVDGETLSLLPDEPGCNAGIDFYKDIGCDIFLLNGCNTRCRFDSPQHCWSDDVEVTQRKEDGRKIVERRISRGALTSITQGSHPIKYPVDSLEAVHIYREMWEGASFIPHDDADTLASLDNLIGEHGVVTRFWGASTIPSLLETDMGTENFYYLMADHPDEMDALIQIIHQRQTDAFRILAEGPWDSVTLIENTSTYYISPDIYRRYNMPHQREFVDTVKAKGKTAILHMCGHVHGILDLIKETHCDGIHALTPPPTGDTPWEDALDVLGDDLIIIAALDATVFVLGPVDDIGPKLDKLITPRLHDANFVLGAFADGIPVEIERFRAVAEWVRENG